MNVAAADVPPPGAGLVTVTCALPELATSAAGMLAVSLTELTSVVVRLEPFHCTTELEMNPEPVTANVNAWLPSVTLAGDMPLTTGAGLEVGGGVDEPPFPPHPVAISTRIPAPAQARAKPPRHRTVVIVLT